jgi:hypothetical protein
MYVIYLIDGLLILAMLFFLFLPITDRKTVRMKLCALGILAAMFAASVAHPDVPALKAHLPNTLLTRSN